MNNSPTDVCVTVHYPLPCARPTRQTLDDLATRLHAAAPNSDARVRLADESLEIRLTVRHASESEAIRLAVTTADAIVGAACTRVQSQPASQTPRARRMLADRVQRS